jgi:predicted lipid-binding transport protein (Tim44 family)
MGSQMIQIVILAGIALFLVLRLRNVLGTREGFEKRPEIAQPTGQPRAERSFEVIEGAPDPDVADFADPESETGKALMAMKRVDRDFSVAEFSHGARQAYEMILMAYENGDVDTLRGLLSPEVFESFEAAIDERAEKGLEVEATFIGVREVKLTDAQFDADTTEADVTMRLVGELTSVVRDAEGNIVEGSPTEVKQQRDLWTFSRHMNSDNPNWLLTGTGG